MMTRRRRIMAAICKMKLTPEVCLRCGRPAWAPFPLCFTWKRLCFLLTLFLSSLLHVEKPKDYVFSDFSLFSMWKRQKIMIFPTWLCFFPLCMKLKSQTKMFSPPFLSASSGKAKILCFSYLTLFLFSLLERKRRFLFQPSQLCLICH